MAKSIENYDSVIKARKKRKLPAHWPKLIRKLGSKPIQPQLALIKRVMQNPHLKAFKKRPLRGINTQWKLNYFVNYKAVITATWGNQKITRMVEPRCIIKYPKGTWFHNCLCPFCRYKKFNLGYKPQRAWNNISGHLLVHPKKLKMGLCGELCWGAEKFNETAIFGRRFIWPQYGRLSHK